MFEVLNEVCVSLSGSGGGGGGGSKMEFQTMGN